VLYPFGDVREAGEEQKQGANSPLDRCVCWRVVVAAGSYDRQLMCFLAENDGRRVDEGQRSDAA